MDKNNTPVQETRGYSAEKDVTYTQRTKEEAADYRYFPDPDIPPFEFTQDQIEKWRLELPVLPAQTRLQLIEHGISEANAIIIVSSPERLQKFDELSKISDPLIVAKAIINCPQENLSNLSILEKTLFKDETKIRQVVEKVVSENSQIVESIKFGKTQAIGALIGQIKKELGDIDIPLTQKIISEIMR